MICKTTEDLCLVVTERCNLNCTYCQSDKSFRGVMSWNCAKKRIDEFLSVTGAARPSITFMGGEPFLGFELIRTIVDYVAAAYPNQRPTYIVVTNGTLVHGDIKEWIKANEDKVQVVLSLDGLGTSHDQNRSHSLRLIDIPFFRSLRKPLVNSVFTPATIGQMAETTIQLHQQGFHVKGFLADGEPWSNADIGVIAEQLAMLIDFYLEHPATHPITLLAQPLYYLASTEPVRRCGTELFAEVSVAADGTLWACHRCSPFENHGTWKIPEKYIGLTNAKHLLPACETCLLERICNACPASNASIKDLAELAETTCNIRKLLFKANAYFALTMLCDEKDFAALRHLTDGRKLQLANAARTILEHLSYK